MHECPNIYAFQAAHPSAIIHPLNKVPPAILAWGLLLLSNARPLASPAVDQPPPAVTLAPLASDQQFVLHMAPSSSEEERTPSDASSALLTYQSGAGLATCSSVPPSLGVCSPPVGIRVPPPVPSTVIAPGIPHVQVPCVPPTSGPPCPDPDGLDEPPSVMGGRQYQQYGCSYGGPLCVIMGGLAPSITPSAFLLLVQRPITGVPVIFQGKFLLQSPFSSMGRVHHTHLMRGLPMCLHLWHLHSLPRLIRCIL
jgi:hypothetical protein